MLKRPTAVNLENDSKTTRKRLEKKTKTTRRKKVIKTKKIAEKKQQCSTGDAGVSPAVNCPVCAGVSGYAGVPAC